MFFHTIQLTILSVLHNSSNLLDYNEFHKVSRDEEITKDDTNNLNSQCDDDEYYSTIENCITKNDFQIINNKLIKHFPAINKVKKYLTV